MSGKAGLIIGLLIGVIIAVAGSLTMMVLATGEMEERQAEAYHRGYDDATKDLPQGGPSISAELNQRTLRQNEELSEALDTARTQLQALNARDDLTPDTREEITRIVNDLPE